MNILKLSLKISWIAAGIALCASSFARADWAAIGDKETGKAIAACYGYTSFEDALKNVRTFGRPSSELYVGLSNVVRPVYVAIVTGSLSEPYYSNLFYGYIDNRATEEQRAETRKAALELCQYNHYPNCRVVAHFVDFPGRPGCFMIP